MRETQDRIATEVRYRRSNYVDAGRGVLAAFTETLLWMFRSEELCDVARKPSARQLYRLAERAPAERVGKIHAEMPAVDDQVSGS